MPDLAALPGQRLTARWTPTQSNFDRFATISGDDNPIHVDPEFSAKTRFGRTVSHGMLLYARVWAMLRTKFPGAVQVAQDLMFPNPAFAGEELSFDLVVEPAPAPDTIELIVAVRRVADDEAVLTGRSRLRIERK